MRTPWLSLSVVVAGSVVVAVVVLYLLTVAGSILTDAPVTRFLAVWLLAFVLVGAVMGSGYAVGYWRQARHLHGTRPARS